MINFEDIGGWHFANELDVVEITTSTAVTITIKDSSNNELLRGSYIPTGGSVKVYHLWRLLNPLIAGVTANFTITVGSTSKTIHVVRSGVSVSESASSFLPSFFLSSVMSERDTTLDRKEVLTFIPIEATLPSVEAECLYWNGESVISSSKSVTATVVADTVCEINVSAAQFVDTLLGELVGYTINAGARNMRYHVRELPTAEVAMIMRNTFGAWETVYFAGMTEDAPEYSRNMAMVNGAMRLYSIEETATMTSWTGPLRPSGVALARDLARSENTYLLESGTATDAVVITASDVKHTSAEEELSDFTFTWRRADLCSARLDTVRPPRLFDDTFDETYE